MRRGSGASRSATSSRLRALREPWSRASIDPTARQRIRVRCVVGQPDHPQIVPRPGLNVKRTPERVSAMHEFDQFPPVTRRTTLVTLVTAGVTGVTRPADANPVLRLALWLLGTVAAWAVGRELDRLVDGRRGPRAQGASRPLEHQDDAPLHACGARVRGIHRGAHPAGHSWPRCRTFWSPNGHQGRDRGSKSLVRAPARTPFSR